MPSAVCPLPKIVSRRATPLMDRPGLRWQHSGTLNSRQCGNCAAQGSLHTKICRHGGSGPGLAAHLGSQSRRRFVERVHHALSLPARVFTKPGNSRSLRSRNRDVEVGNPRFHSDTLIPLMYRGDPPTIVLPDAHPDTGHIYGDAVFKYRSSRRVP